MKKSRLEKLEIYGTIKVKINNDAFVNVNFNKNKISLFIYKKELFSRLLKESGFNLERITKLGKISEKLHKIGIGISVSDSKGLIVKLGVGAYNPLVKAKINIKRIAEFL